MRRQKISEAATIKARARGAIRVLDKLLADKTLPESIHRQVEELRGSLKKTWGQLEKEAVQDHGHRGVAAQDKESAGPIGEAMAKKTKTIRGKAYPASSFLVVGDPESPDTWSLPVKDESGQADPKLMGAAHAALTKNFRGKPYQGPDKAKALAALKKMYAAMDMAWPEESGEAMSEAEQELLAEYGYDPYGGTAYIPSSITSFAQLRQAEAAREIACDMREAVGQFQGMLENIFYYSPPEIDKLQAAQALFDEFIGVMDEILTGQGEDEAGGLAGGEAAPTSETVQNEGEPVSFSESYEPVVTIEEADGASPRGPLEMDVQLIRPGWGNSRDNHYYPAEMLKRDAHVFEGAKMYTTDHRSEEKSERTEVSQIKAITGFTETGAPVARVVVFDPDFAEKCRNRKKAGLLESLECSILADGRARAGYEEGGRKGKLVEEITAVSSVDWVTRAGAGGRALSLAESQPEHSESASTETVDPVGESAPAAEPVTIREEDAASQDAPPPAEESPASDAAPAPDPAEQAMEPAETVSVETPSTESAALGEAEIRAALGKTNLPGASVLQLAFGKYATAEALQEAIQAEIQKVKETTGSGRPFGLGESSSGVVQPPASREKIEEVMDQVNSRFGIGR